MRFNRLAAAVIAGAASLVVLAPAAFAKPKPSPERPRVPIGSPNASNVIVTYAGDGQKGGSRDDGPGRCARICAPSGVALDNAAHVFFTDSATNVVGQVDAAMVVTRVAGTGLPGFSGDGGPAASARFHGPTGIAVTGTGVLFVADTQNNRVRRISQGRITTVAGNGIPGYSGDGGPATAAKLKKPTGLALDGAGNLFIADTENNVVREVLSNGTIRTFAGTGRAGFSGNTGSALAAKLNGPIGVAVSGSRVLISDTGNDQVREVRGGTITAFAGTGQPGFSGDRGQATSARLRKPSGVTFDPMGNVYIVDGDNDRLRQVTASGVISTFAGTGHAGFSGDGGPATSAQIDLEPSRHDGITADATNVFFADTVNSRVRRVHKGGPPPALPEAPFSQSVLLAGSVSVLLAGAVVVMARRRRREQASAHSI